MSNLDFFLEAIPMDDVTVIKKDDTTVIRATFNGSEDLSWFEMEYIFDKNGNYLSSRETDSHY